MSDEFLDEEFESGFVPETFELCGCGCSRNEHDEVTGRCLYCGEDDCGGFEVDEDATLWALATMEDRP